jgi:hypothetical protein
MILALPVMATLVETQGSLRVDTDQQAIATAEQQVETLMKCTLIRVARGRANFILLVPGRKSPNRVETCAANERIKSGHVCDGSDLHRIASAPDLACKLNDQDLHGNAELPDRVSHSHHGCPTCVNRCPWIASPTRQASLAKLAVFAHEVAFLPFKQILKARSLSGYSPVGCRPKTLYVGFPMKFLIELAKYFSPRDSDYLDFRHSAPH